MPFYEYECSQCRFRFEELLPYSEREAAEQRLACPKCGAKHPRRLVSTFAATGASPEAAPGHSCGSGG